MVHISTFVLFDIETTGLPWQEKNQTKITDFSFISVTREDLQNATLGVVPPVSKLCFPLQPERQIHYEVVKLTGLTNETLKYASTFKQKVKSIVTFLEELPKPVCLVAHNGNVFDYKILLAELNDAKATLPEDLLCVDSLVGIRKILKSTKDVTPQTNVAPVIKSVSISSKQEDILTDDEDEWPDLDVTPQDWEEIDELCESLSDLSGFDTDEEERIKKAKREAVRKVFDSKHKNRNVDNVKKLQKKETSKTNSKEGYSLSVLYKKFLNKEEIAHRAEADCLMLLQCVVALKQDFIQWADEACKLLTEVKPLQRYKVQG